VGWAALPSPHAPCHPVPDPGFLRSRGLCFFQLGGAVLPHADDRFRVPRTLAPQRQVSRLISGRRRSSQGMSVRPHPRADRPQVRIALGMGLGDRLHLLLRRRIGPGLLSFAGQTPAPLGRCYLTWKRGTWVGFGNWIGNRQSPSPVPFCRPAACGKEREACCGWRKFNVCISTGFAKGN